MSHLITSPICLPTLRHKHRPLRHVGQGHRAAVLPRLLPQLHSGVEPIKARLPPVQGAWYPQGGRAAQSLASRVAALQATSNRPGTHKPTQSQPQGRISGYRYNIQSDVDFQEVSFSPSPPRHPERPTTTTTTTAAAAAYARSVIDVWERPPGGGTGTRGDAGGLRVDRGYRTAEGDGRRSSSRSSRGVDELRERGRRREGGGDGAPGGSQQPRPYYYRMQQHVLSRCVG